MELPNQLHPLPPLSVIFSLFPPSFFGTPPPGLCSPHAHPHPIPRLLPPDSPSSRPPSPGGPQQSKGQSRTQGCPGDRGRKSLNSLLSSREEVIQSWFLLPPSRKPRSCPWPGYIIIFCFNCIKANDYVTLWFRSGQGSDNRSWHSLDRSHFEAVFSRMRTNNFSKVVTLGKQAGGSSLWEGVCPGSRQPAD